MKQVKTAEDLYALPNLSVIILHHETGFGKAVDMAVQKFDNDEWFACGVPFPRTTEELVAKSFPQADQVYVVHEPANPLLSEDVDALRAEQDGLG